MKRQMRTALYSSVALAAMAASVPVIAQEITSTIRGTVVDASGNGLANMEVSVTHDASGSRRTFTTGNNGAFVARGLRPGGPYSIAVAGNGSYEGQTIAGIYLKVNQPLPLTIPLSSVGASVEEIQITARRLSSTLRSGGSAAYDANRISDLPSISRDFKDTLRQNPFINLDSANGDSLSVAGSNDRFNSITLDGVRQDDTFGLNSSGVPTQRSPISIDTIEQVSGAVAPFGVQFGGFTGGQFNVVTKSGTNEFHGTAFYQYTDQGLVGDKSGNGDGDPTNDGVDLGVFKEKFYGATLGGPIVKDKLFFFAAYEKFEGSTPNLFGTEDSGAANAVRGVTSADFNQITQIARDVYGYDTQGLDSGDIPEIDEKIYAKIDWNINDNHRTFLSYQRTEGNALRVQDSSASRGNLGAVSHWYNRSETLEAWNFQLFSDWSDNLSTELKLGLSDQDTGQVSLSEPGVGEIRIDTAGGGTVYLGTDDSRHANQLSNETLNLKFKADYVAGDHTFTAGYELNQVETFNVFIQRALGVWRFDSIDDFENRIASQFDYQNAVTNNSEDGAAQFTISTHTFYLQDRWDIGDKLVITGGIRADYYKQPDSPALNNNFVTRNGFDNTKTYDGELLIQPRFGFSYDLDDKTQITGGVGRFGGGDPTVWVSNAFSLDGVTISTFGTTRGRSSENLDVLDNVSIRSIPQIAQDALALGNGDVAATDPDFDIPSVWKYNLGVERFFDFGPLGDDWRIKAEAIWTRTDKAADWKELRRVQTGTAIDGSPIYVPFQRGYDILLTNTSGGKSDVYSIAFDKSWDFGLSVFGSYAFTDSESVNEGTSSTASSNFNFAAHLDRNNRQLGTSPFETRHAIKLGATYRKDFWDDNTTKISLFYSGRSGRPFSLTLDEFLQFGGSSSIDFGDGHLLYVPTAAESAVAVFDGDGNPTNTENVIFETQQDLDTFNLLVDNLGLVRGQSVEKQGQRGPWLNELDLRFSQEVPVGSFGKVELWLDMENVLNFLDSDWGRYDRVRFPQITAADVDVLSDGRFLYSDVFSSDISGGTFQVRQSVWKVQLGVKYKF